MSQPPPKKDVADALVERGSVFVYLDPRRVGVAVPLHLKQQPQLVLQVGLGLTIPIRDLEIDEEGVFGTLSFNRSPFYCRIPWPAVFGLFGDDGMGVVWQEDFPADVTPDLVERARPVRTPPKLQAIQGGASSGATESDAAETVTAESDTADSDTAEADTAETAASEDAASETGAASSDTSDGSDEPTPAPRNATRPKLRLVK